MREPGRWILPLADGCCTARFREAVVVPVLADLQHEHAAANGRVRQAVVRGRGYLSLLAATTLYTLLMPGRHLRENWSAADAPGPRLVRAAWPIVATILVLGVAALRASGYVRSVGRPPFSLPPFTTFVLLLPGQLVLLLPLALAVGVGWVVAREPRCRRAAMALGLVASAFTFVLLERVVTGANQAFRETVQQAARAARAPLRQSRMHTVDGRIVVERRESNVLPRGDREMRLTELSAAVAGHQARIREGFAVASYRALLAPLLVEWHKRFTLPLLCLSLVVLSLVLAGGGRRWRVVLGVAPAWVAAYFLLRVGESYADKARIPVAVAMWGPHVLLVMLSLLVALRYHARTAATVRAA